MYAWVFAAAAWADPAFEDLGFVISAPSSGSFTGGVNAPTVEYDPATATYVMYFESPQATWPGDCVNAYVIGRATSPDGLTWTVDPTPVVTPDTSDPTSHRYCSVAQPAVVYDGTTWHLFFSEAGAKASSSSANNTPQGIAYATSPDGVDFTVVADPAIAPGSTSAPIGLSSATIVGDELYVVYSHYPDLAAATAAADGTATTFTTTELVVDHAAQSWSSTWALGPSLFCDDGPSPSFELTLGGDAGSTRALAFGTASDPTDWTLGSPLSVGTLVYGSLKHWDTLGFNGSGDYLMWYGADDPTTGVKGIGFASTTPSWGAPQERYCDGVVPPEGSGGGDTGGGDTAGDSGGRDTGGGDTGGGDTAGDSGGGDSGGGDTSGDSGSGGHPGGGWHGCGGCWGDADDGWWFAGLAGLIVLPRRRR